MTANNLVPDRWYIDRSPGHEGVPLDQKFLLLVVADQTVDVEDEFGNRRTVNRIRWEADMVLLRQPMRRGD